MSIENLNIVVKKYRVHKSDVLESLLSENSVEEGRRACKNLDEMAALEAHIHPEVKEIHYLGEKGVVDYRLISGSRPTCSALRLASFAQGYSLR